MQERKQEGKKKQGKQRGKETFWTNSTIIKVTGMEIKEKRKDPKEYVYVCCNSETTNSVDCYALPFLV